MLRKTGYRCTRNPMYLGLLLILLGAALLTGNLAALALWALLPPIYTRCFIRGEERRLEESFGKSYRAYRRRVRRWL